VVAVEDERLVARDLQLRLNDLGFEVPALATSADEAVEVVNEVRPNVVLMDIRLEGGRDGIEAARIVREHFDIPVIFVTAHADAETLKRARDTAPFGYILKPFDDRELQAAIEIAIYKHDTERRLREAQERLRQAQRVAQLGNWEQELSTADIHLSPEACEIMGVSRDAGERMSAEEFFEVVHPEDRLAVREAFQASAMESKSLRIEHRLVTAWGVDKFLRQFGELQRGRHGMGGRLLGTVQDITEYKQLEEKLRRAQKLEAIGQLAGGVAHDFNNLLVVIRGYTDMILSDLGPEDPLVSQLREVMLAADRATALTRQLLAFSCRQVMRPHVLNLNELINNIERMLRRILVETIELRKDLAPSWPVKVDPGQIEQIIVNLVVNARDAMPKGGVLTIGTANADLSGREIQTSADLKPGRYVCLSVSDNGTGIPPEIKDRLFEPFFSTKPVGQGTGLGLSTVYGIAKQHGGDVSVQSEAGRGSVFRVYLPATDQPQEAALEDELLQSLYRGTENILLAEDDESVRKLALRVLERLGYTVVAARSGRDALEAGRAPGKKFDLLLTDVVMPEMGGQELAEKISAFQPGIRVVFMSGYPRRPTSDAGVSGGDLQFLEKPFSAEELGRRIREALD
jgi:PAS domain S-box-containing protein